MTTPITDQQKFKADTRPITMENPVTVEVVPASVCADMERENHELRNRISRIMKTLQDWNYDTSRLMVEVGG